MIKAIADVCVVPIGVGVSVSRYVAVCEEILGEAGLSPRLHAYGTNVEGDWDTVGGLVFDLFGRVPKRGEDCTVDGYVLRVDQVHGRRITKVTVSQPQTIRTPDDG